MRRSPHGGAYLTDFSTVTFPRPLSCARPRNDAERHAERHGIHLATSRSFRIGRIDLLPNGHLDFNLSFETTSRRKFGPTTVPRSFRSTCGVIITRSGCLLVAEEQRSKPETATSAFDAVDGAHSSALKCRRVTASKQTRRGGPSMGDASTIGLDIAKSVFQVHGVAVDGAVVVRKRFSRAKVLEFSAQCRLASLELKRVRPRIIGVAGFRHSAIR